jgi:molecular chaperone DnaK
VRNISKKTKGKIMAIIGIDLGTSNSAAAVLRAGKPVIIPSTEGISLSGKAFPSYVDITADGSKLVGEPARRQAAENPSGTASAFKRKMGKREKIQLRDKEFTPEQLSAFLLQKIKNDAEAYLGEKVEKAVVTVPAYFDDNQRSATKDACKIAGLEVVRLVNEPTAAALAYGLDRSGEDIKITVIDFGGGTLDVTIMEFGKGVFEVKSTSGDTQLGGTDMNQVLYEHLAEKFKIQSGIDLKSDTKAAARLIEAAEMAKIELSTSTTTHVSLPYISGDKHLDIDLTRTELDRLVHPVIERCKGPIEQALKDADLSEKEIDRIVFVGGPTRMPAVREYFEKLLGKKAEGGVDPMECVASGAAIQAGVLSGEVGDIVLVDVTPLSLGVETLGGVVTTLIGRNSPIPVKHSETFTTAVDMQTSVTVHVVQGERPMAADNASLGQFNLDGIVPAARGVPKIDVTFDIDASGILNVTAKDVATGKSQSIKITASTRLSSEEKERMVKEAEKYADEDKKRKEKADKLNKADAICYESERLLVEYGEKLDSSLRSKIEAKLKEAKEAVQNSDIDAATERSEALQELVKQAGSTIYGQSQGQASSGSQQTEQSSEQKNGNAPYERVVDADFHENN